MTMSEIGIGARERELRERAARVVPSGMYGHMTARDYAPSMPQYLTGGEGSRIWDADGREYIDYMCSWGPMVLGHRHPVVEAAAEAQRRQGDCLSGPGPVLVELAELFVATVPHADWAMFAKNGTDVTTLGLMVARAHTRKRAILAAAGSYHGAAPWCNPWPRGLLAEDKAHISYFRYNDLESAREAAAAVGDDLAGVIVTPFRHDAGHDQEDVDPAFARGLRALCDEAGAALILDDVRAGLRLDPAGSWEPIGVRPDLSAWGKAIGNGYPLSALVGSDTFRRAAERIFTTGSFWFSSVSMAASVATITTVHAERAHETMARIGRLLRDGIASQAAEHGVAIKQTGPVQLPNLSFDGDEHFERALVFADECARRGVFVHPSHNWFLSSAHTEDDVDRTLEAMGHAFARVAAELGTV